MAYIYLRLPVYDLEGIKRGLRQQLVLSLHQDEINQIQYLFSKYNRIICYTDGSSLRNPGFAGAGAVFVGKNVDYDSDDDLDGSDSHLQLEAQESDEIFLFGLSLHLGQASNNYAEYTGLILGQLFFALFDQTRAHICTDSQLVVQQVKGQYKTKEVRLVELIKVAHHLTFKF